MRIRKNTSSAISIYCHRETDVNTSTNPNAFGILEESKTNREIFCGSILEIFSKSVIFIIESCREKATSFFDGGEVGCQKVSAAVKPRECNCVRNSHNCHKQTQTEGVKTRRRHSGRCSSPSVLREHERVSLKFETILKRT